MKGEEFYPKKNMEYCYFFGLNSSCESIMPAKIITQPITDVNDIVSPNKSIHPTAQNTDSNEKIIADSVGPECF